MKEIYLLIKVNAENKNSTNAAFEFIILDPAYKADNMFQKKIIIKYKIMFMFLNKKF